MRSNLARTILLVAAATLVAGALRVHSLGQPDRKVFDEVYYASDGCLYAGHDFRDCDLEDDGERSWVHPPLGKALIAMGIDGFGNRPFGWRIAGAAAGTATVALVGALAYLLFRKPVWAGVASLLLATEHLHFVQSRVSMLDVFLAFFVVLGFVLLVADRRRQDAREAAAIPLTAPDEAEARPTMPAPVFPGSRLRPLRLAAGAAFGAAIAVKWSGVFALAGAFVLAFAWARSLVRRGVTVPRAEAVGLPVALVLVPLVVYLAAWGPWMAGPDHGASDLFGHHLAIADYHMNLETVKEDGDPVHPYMSPAWKWFLLLRPVAYYWQGNPRCCAEILGMGNPFLFWGALVVIPYLAVAGWRRRDWRAGAVLVPILAQYLPWLAVTRPLFLFYMTPVAPFLAVGATFLLRDLVRARVPGRRTAIAAAAAVVAVSVALFAFFWPVLTGERLSYEAWQQRMWLDRWV